MQTEEQQNIFDKVINSISREESLFMKIEAVAGAGKTWTLRKIAEMLPENGHCLYLAYNKSIATEATHQFPKNTECRTTHALAYEPIIKYGLDKDGNVGKPRKVGIFNYRNIEEDLDYEEKYYIIQTLNAFFLSASININEYMKDKDHAQLMINYFNKMVNKEIDVPHSFYLKYYHMLLQSGVIHYDDYDCIMLDEAGDINAVTLEIFKLLPSRCKVMVGDSQQNIYSFNHTINGFEKTCNLGSSYPLTQSFRCSKEIAEIVLQFINHNLDPHMEFVGTDLEDRTINTRAFIARTNSTLIMKMISLAMTGTKFKTIKSPVETFALLLTLLNLYKKEPIWDPRYKFLEHDRDEFYNDSALRDVHNNNILKYIGFLYEDDRDIQIALRTINTYKAANIYSAYKFAKDCYESNEPINLFLTTAHSSKGLTFDEVTLADDFNFDDVKSIPFEDRTHFEQEELRLLYVALTRARIRLINYRQFIV